MSEASTPIASKSVPKAQRHKIDPAKIDYTSDKQRNAVQALMDEFTISTDLLKDIKNNFIEGMNKGLERDGETLAMIPSHVLGRLDGSEIGSYLALDIGGTNLRVVSVHLTGKGKPETYQTKYPIEEKLKVGEAKALFDYMADKVGSFLDEHKIKVAPGTQIELGFTFSFPVLQTSINRGKLIKWTKGFSAAGMVGKDPVAFLQDAFTRRHIPVRVAALVNDTVGTLLAHAYENPDTVMGVILGTGCNGAYIENIDKIKKWKDEDGEDVAKEMIINMEFGAFDKERAILPLTMFDNKLDRKSVNPNSQILEKMIAGMYLGEITRNVLLNLIDRRLLFQGQTSPDLNQMWTFETAYMSAIEADTSPRLHATRKILESTLSFQSTELIDRQITKLVVELVGRRAARLSAAAIAGVLEHTGQWKQKAAIGIDGSLFEYYPSFDTDIMDGLVEVFGEGVRSNVSIGLAQDGSGVGAALCALLAAKHSSNGAGTPNVV
ncbi:glucokinase [Gryganskiella cystojenkinii]|nr:glucokinase [Gryganskiella cystojenkinii]